MDCTLVRRSIMEQLCAAYGDISTNDSVSYIVLLVLA